MHKERLQILARRLRGLAPREQAALDLTVWVCAGKYSWPFENSKLDTRMLAETATNSPEEAWELIVDKVRNCGTSACAVGIACMTSELVAQGLFMQAKGFSLLPRFNEAVGWPAVEQFFELCEKDAEFLFSNVKYYARGRRITALEVATRIEQYIEDES